MIAAVGMEWVVEAHGCNAERLRALHTVQGVCEAIVRDLDLHVVGAPQWHAFPGAGGVTGLYLLSESHLACHTYPEFSACTLNLYSCRERAPWRFEAQLKEALLATSVSVRSVERRLHP